eukprot:m.174152 g.174152  ORF g.174152 m.174152 type:complete len:102 (+) comp14590_c0_seq13:1067-1372(+)
MRSGLSLFLLCHSNWRKEFEKWFPACVVEVLHGAERATLVTKLKAAAKLKHSKRGFDVILTTYEMVSREKGVLSRFQFDFVVVDEAHRLKNEKSQVGQTHA